MLATVAFIGGTIAVVGPPARVLAVGPVATATVTAPAIAPLLGEQSTLVVTFDNSDSSSVGYAPYLDILINSVGADGPGAAIDDGLVLATMSLVGSPVAAVTPGGTACSGAPMPHPLTTLPVTCMSGLRLFVFPLPFGSFTPNQPIARLDTTVTMSNLADVGMALSVSAVPGFALGNSPSGSVAIVGTAVTTSVTPQIARITATYEGVDDETATGPNFTQRYVVSADLPNSVVFSSVRINDTLPSSHQFVAVTTVMPSPASIGNPSTAAPGGTMTRQWGPITGGVGLSDVSVRYSFSVPRLNAAGAVIVAAATGDDSPTVNDSSLVLTYKPADTRDPTTTTTLNPNTTDNHTLIAKSIAIQQTSAITDNAGSAMFAAGDTLAYTVTGQVSDFFSAGGLVLTDVLSDGQTLVDGSAAFTSTSETITSAAWFDAADVTVDTTARTTCGNGTTTVTFRLSQALVRAGSSGIVVGGLVHTTPDRGAATFEIRFNALVSDAYACLAIELPIDEGDRVDNNVSVVADLYDAAGASLAANEVDTSATSRAIETTPVTTTAYARNGVIGPFTTANAGDLITYRIQTTSPSSDFEALTLTDFVALPIFTVGSFSNAAVTASCATPAVNSACYGPTDTLHSNGTAPDPTVSTDAVSGVITFNFATHDDPANNPSEIDLLFTVGVTASAFRDGLIFTNQVVKRSANSFGAATSSTSIVQLVLAEPVLDIAKGVIGAGNPNASGLTITETREPTGVTWFEPGPSAVAPGFTGNVTSDALAGGAPDADAADVDAADLVRFAIVVESTGSGAGGVFDVAIADTFPDGFVVPAAGIRLHVADGAGNALGNSASGAFIAAPGTGGGQTGTITLTDGPTGALVAGTTDGVNNASGTNVAVITYELEVAATAVPNTMHTNTATLAGFAATDGGPNFIAMVPQLDRTNVASVTTAPAGITKFVNSSNQSFTSGNRVAVGEVVEYQVVLTVPEGTSRTLALTDVLDVGQAFVSIDSITAAAALASTTGFPAALTAARGTLSTPGRTASFGFGDVTNVDRDNAVAETIVVVYQAIVLNVGTNTIDLTSDNTATVSHLGNTEGSIDQASVTIVEPVLVSTKSATPTTADANDVVTFVVDVRHTGELSDTDAFDVSTVDVIPAGMTYVDRSLATVGGAARVPLTLVIDGTTITARWAALAATPFQFGQITYRATLGPDTIAPTVFTSAATTTWTSLPGLPVTASSYNTNDTERTGADGVGGLNDYRTVASASVSVAGPELAKILSATDDPNTAGSSVTIGEIGTYQLVVSLPEGANNGFDVSDSLPNGLRLTGTPTVIVEAAASSGALASDFSGELGAQTFSTSTAGTIDTIMLHVAATTVTSDNDPGNNSFAIRVDGVVADMPGNIGIGPTTVLENIATVQLPGGLLVTSNVVGLNVVEPRLDVVTTFMSSAATPGSTVTVMVAVQNVGLSGGFDSVVTDTLDAHLDATSVSPTSVPVGWTFAQTGAALRWTADGGVAMATGMTASFEFTVALLASTVDGVTIGNTASAVTTTRDGAVAGERVEPASGGSAILGVVVPDLTVSMSDGVTATTPGSTLDYVVLTSNIGGAPAANVVLTNTLPPGTTFISVAQPCLPGTASTATTQIIEIGTIVAGTTASCTITVGVDDPAPAGTTSYLDQVSVADDAANGADPTPANNSSVDNDTITAHPAVSVTKNDGVASLGAGAASSYVVTVANRGDIGATNVLITDALPAGFIFTSCANGTGSFAAACTMNGGVVSTTVSLLAGRGATATLTISGTIVTPAPAGWYSIVNTVHVVDDGANGVDLTTTDNSATDSDEIVASPDLVIAKSTPNSTVRPGGAIAYTITVTNSGTRDATGVTVDDPLPIATTAVCGSETPTATACDGNGYVWTVAVLSVGESIQFTFAASVADPMPARSHVVTNTATVADDGTNGPDPTPENNHASVDVGLVGYFVDLAVTKTDGVAAAAPGSTLTYAITVSNDGNIEASGVRVVDVIPPGTTFAAAPDTGHGTGVNTDGSVTWNVGSLAGGGATSTLSLIVTVDVPVAAGREQLVNLVGVDDDGFSGADATPGNNVASDSDDLTAAPNLRITQSDGTVVAAPGTALTYVVVVTNTGSQDATGVTIDDTIGPGMTFVSAGDLGSGAGTFAAGHVVWNVGNVPAGASRTVSVIVHVTSPAIAGRDQLLNTVTVADDGTNGIDATPADNTVTDTDALDAAPDLVVTTTDDVLVVRVGDIVTYAIAVGNVGTQDATGVVLTDASPDGTLLLAAPGGTPTAGLIAWPAFDMAAGAVAHFTASFTVVEPVDTASESVINTATATDDATNGPDQNPLDNTGLDTDTLVADSALTITVTDGVDSTAPGNTLTYVLTVSNNGNQPALAHVTDLLPIGGTFVDAPSTAASAAAGLPVDSVVTWPDFSLSPGGSAAVSLVVAVDAPAPAGVEQLTNTARVSDTAVAGPGPAPAIDTDALDARPDLVVTKSDGRTDVAPGDTLTYTVTVSNVGDQDASGVIVADRLPAGVELVSSTDAGVVSIGEVAWAAIPLGGGATVSHTVTVVVAGPGARSSFELDNVAVVGDDGSGGPDPTLANNIATDHDLIDNTLDLAITNSNGTATSTPGTSSTWQLTITNLGASPVGHFRVSGVLPQQLSNVTYGTSAGTYDLATEVWSGPSVAGGATVTIEVTGLIAADATGTLTHEATVAPLDGLVDRAPNDNRAVDIDDFVVAPVVPAVVGWIPIAGSDVLRVLVPAVMFLLGGMALLVSTRHREIG